MKYKQIVRKAIAHGKFLTSGHVSLFNEKLRSAYKITGFFVQRTEDGRRSGRRALRLLSKLN